WGGYYVSKPADEDKFSVFRLLDFNRDAYHAALFAETFPSPPKLKHITAMSPFIGHAPFDARGLVVGNNEIRLIGGKPLSRDDLDGYMYYLEAHEVSQDEMNELSERLISLSYQPPLQVNLKIVDDKLVISEW
ncbi:MAG: hypothetical protein ACRDBG_06710, partial [Waterburya sp.]